MKHKRSTYEQYRANKARGKTSGSIPSRVMPGKAELRAELDRLMREFELKRAV